MHRSPMKGLYSWIYVQHKAIDSISPFCLCTYVFQVNSRVRSSLKCFSHWPRDFCLQLMKIDRKNFQPPPILAPVIYLLCNNLFVLHCIDFHYFNVVYIELYACFFTNVVPSFLPLFILINVFCHMDLHRVLDSNTFVLSHDSMTFFIR